MKGPAENVGADYDPVTAEVISMALQDIAIEMSITVERTSGSPGVAEAQDYSCVIVRPDGTSVAYHGNNLEHMGSSWCGTRAIVDQFPESEIQEGDVFIYNDPYVTGALHQTDVAVQKPIFHEGKLVAWAFANVHEPDIGAMSPWGFAPEAPDIYSEGLCIPPMKLVDAGVPNQAIYDFLESNSRTGPIVVGDTRACLAANNVCERRFKEVIDSYGLEELERYLDINQELVGRILRDRINRIRPGVYEARDWVEYDAFVPKRLVDLPCRLTIGDGHLTFDFSGAAEQTRGYCNSSEGALMGAIMALVIQTLLPDFPVNGGAYACVTIDRGEVGSVVNPHFPAGVSGGHQEAALRANRVAHTALIRALAVSEDPWIRSRAFATASQAINVAIMTGILPGGGETFAFTLDVVCQGAGANLTQGDGQDFGGPDYSTFGRDPDVEVIEASGPVLYLWRREMPDSGGAGLFRGGNGIEVGFAPWDCETGEIAFSNTGNAVPAQGAQGAFPPGTSRMEIHRGLAAEVISAGWRLPALEGRADPEIIRNKTARAEVALADVARNITSGGCGLGDPLLRDPLAVAADVASGSVSEFAAAQIYGVVVSSEDAVDGKATEARRATIRRDRLGGSDPQKVAAPPADGLPGLGPIEGDQLACAQCDEALGSIETWQESAHTRVSDLAEAMTQAGVPVAVTEAGTMQLVEHFCPVCASALETIVSDGVAALPRFYAALPAEQSA